MKIQRIYKYKLKDSPFTLPVDSIVRHVGMQNGEIHLWIEIDQSIVACENRRFFYIGTGHSIPEGAFYHGTVHDAPFVWHVFEEKI